MSISESEWYQPVVVSGPSGVGKSTILKFLFDDFPDCFAFSVSHTTRKPREGEKHGEHYYFVPESEMRAMIDRGDFLEHATFSGNLYGTSKQAVEAIVKTGKICILDLEEQGVKNMKQTGINARYVFIKPPSMEELEKRLRQRGTESDAAIKSRMQTAESALKYADKKGAYDAIITNTCKNTSYEQLKGFLMQDIMRIYHTKYKKF